jgi:hypothetical protein
MPPALFQALPDPLMDFGIISVAHRIEMNMRTMNLIIHILGRG